MVRGGVDRNAAEPRGEARIVPEAREAPPCANKHLLGNLFGGRVAAHEAEAQTVDAVLIPLNQLRKRMAVASLCSKHKGLVGVIDHGSCQRIVHV